MSSHETERVPGACQLDPQVDQVQQKSFAENGVALAEYYIQEIIDESPLVIFTQRCSKMFFRPRYFSLSLWMKNLMGQWDSDGRYGGDFGVDFGK